jgi:hypothetical protein
MKLRSKYAVTLYEILEAYANRENKTLIAPVEDVRSWLKVPEEAAYGVWRAFRRRVIEPGEGMPRGAARAVNAASGGVLRCAPP